VSAGIALVFPGQGSQRPGMLSALPGPEALSRLLDAAEGLTGLQLREIAENGTPEELSDTRAAQPLLYLADWAWGRAVTDAGVVPALVAGHSLGELAALAVAGVFSVEAGLELVCERARLMARCAAATPGGMAAIIGLDSFDVSRAISGIDGVWVANDNAPGQVVVSGTHEGLAAASAVLESAGARRIVPLNVAGPFHCPLMEPAADSFSALLDRATLVDAGVPVCQNTDPTPLTDAAAIRTRLASQIVSPVRWTETMRAFVAAGATSVVEAGPGSVLKGLAKRVEGLTAVSAEESGLDGILKEVSLT
jgi:[acyl-carrier-protein] S-malonyltransferase